MPTTNTARHHLLTLAATLAALVWLSTPAAAEPVFVDFEPDEGYAPGNLYGQPAGAAHTWTGPDSAGLVVTDEADHVKEGTQSLQVWADWGNHANDLEIGTVPTQFTWKFFWSPGPGIGKTTAALAAGPDWGDMGPYLIFDTRGGAIWYMDGPSNVSDRHLIYELQQGQGDWLAIRIEGDVATDTFDFYVGDDDIPEATDCGFKYAQEELNALQFRCYATDNGRHFYDAVHVGEIPEPAPVWLLAISIAAVRRRR